MAAKKGIVMEKGNGWAVILTPQGEYKKIKTHEYLEVGELYQDKLPLPIKYVTAAVILLALVMAGIDYFSVQAYAQVSSLAQLGVNRWGRVVAVQSKDSNGQRILETVDIKNDKLELAVEKICSQSLKDKQSKSELIQEPEFSVTPAKKAQPALEKKILNKMDQGYKKAVHQQAQDSKVKEKPVKEELPPKQTTKNTGGDKQVINQDKGNRNEPGKKDNLQTYNPNYRADKQPPNYTADRDADSNKQNKK